MDNIVSFFPIMNEVVKKEAKKFGASFPYQQLLDPPILMFKLVT